jgi:hypothetical protein
MNDRWMVCERVQSLGYSKERKVKLYSEEVHLTSNPVPDGDGFVGDGTSTRHSIRKRIQVPLPVVRMIERELALAKKPAAVA